MTLTNAKYNTSITWVESSDRLFPLLRVWIGPGRSGGIETSKSYTTPQKRDAEVAALLRPTEPAPWTVG